MIVEHVEKLDDDWPSDIRNWAANK